MSLIRVRPWIPECKSCIIKPLWPFLFVLILSFPLLFLVTLVAVHNLIRPLIQLHLLLLLGDLLLNGRRDLCSCLALSGNTLIILSYSGHSIGRANLCHTCGSTLGRWCTQIFTARNPTIFGSSQGIESVLLERGAHELLVNRGPWGLGCLGWCGMRTNALIVDRLISRLTYWLHIVLNFRIKRLLLFLSYSVKMAVNLADLRPGILSFHVLLLEQLLLFFEELFLQRLSLLFLRVLYFDPSQAI